jgi:hypothetical protein
VTWREELKTWSPAAREDWEERAAIMEYMGGLPRERAEFEAYKDVKRQLAARAARR